MQVAALALEHVHPRQQGALGGIVALDHPVLARVLVHHLPGAKLRLVGNAGGIIVHHVFAPHRKAARSQESRILGLEKIVGRCSKEGLEPRPCSWSVCGAQKQSSLLRLGQQEQNVVAHGRIARARLVGRVSLCQRQVDLLLYLRLKPRVGVAHGHKIWRPVSVALSGGLVGAQLKGDQFCRLSYIPGCGEFRCSHGTRLQSRTTRCFCPSKCRLAIFQTLLRWSSLTLKATVPLRIVPAKRALRKCFICKPHWPVRLSSIQRSV